MNNTPPPIQVDSPGNVIENNIYNETTIKITQNIDFETYKTYGNGSASNPYVIEDISVYGVATCGIGIDIQNTDAHFILRNLTISFPFTVGMKLVNVTNGEIVNNSISEIKGSNGMNGGTDQSGTTGTQGIGIALTNCTYIAISSNNIFNILGGNGGKGGDGSSNNPGQKGGDGNKASGIYLKDSADCLISHNTLSSINGGSGGNGGKGSDTSELFMDGYIGGKGSMGGGSSGIYIESSLNVTNDWNVIKNIFGGDGGIGGAGGDSFFSIGGAGGAGGAGGNITSGIHFGGSMNVTNGWNVIKNVTGGAGGAGGAGGLGLISNGANGGNGKGGMEYGILLDNSNNSVNIFNSIYCQNNTDNGMNNKWDDGNIGNYWSYYSGMDVNPYDGIGDTPHFLNGTANSKDNKPVMFPFGSDFDGDGLNNSEEYALGMDGYRTNVTTPDSDYDEISDYWEFQWGTNPTNPDTDGDGLNDSAEVFIYPTNATNPDTDGDGLNDGDEIITHTTDPLDADTDDDLLPDKWEVDNALSPINALDASLDIEMDGLINIQEYYYNTDPRDFDSDEDGHSDGAEVAAGTDPLDQYDFPSPPEPESILLELSILIGCIAIAAAIVIYGILQRSRPIAAPPTSPKQVPPNKKQPIKTTQ